MNVDALPPADWVIDAAANPSVLAGVDGKTSSLQLVQHNLLGTINLLEYCKRYQAGFTLLSTSRVYSIPGLSQLQVAEANGAFYPIPEQVFPVGISPMGVAENYSTNPPVSLYGSTKVASEHLALEYGETFNFPVWINRCGVWCINKFGTNEVLETNIERPFDIPWMVLDASLVEQVWGWKPQISIEEVLEKISKFASELQNWCRLSSI